MHIVKLFKNIFESFSRKIRVDNLICGIGESEIRENAIFISNYPFEPSLAYPEKLIKASEIDAICIEFGASKIRISDDIVFVSAEKKDQMKIFAERNNIPLSLYSWNWDWILEPYLDTEFTEENKKLTTERLHENGLNTIEVDAIRKEIGKQMYRYNFDTMLWDWCSLSLQDVLSAMRAKYNKEEFREFYKKAIEIENRKKQS
ncbi:hypothetical protein [uncultured Aquimarina sp.]|uniref:hypothetical protein n=1 Tax=uncultured Aquimarina sp. TaxID=575652 RepID=UPI00260F5548|nr:hypothetical protein [uncultured Aquimarina sp.]